MRQTSSPARLRARLFNALLRRLILTIRRDSWDIQERRRKMDQFSRLLFKLPKATRCERFQIAHMPAEWIEVANANHDRILLYFHGGGYVLCSIETHRHLIAALAQAARARALAVDYRLAPEHRYPAALEDALAAYRWLLDLGVAPERIITGGDSAGGGLSIAVLIAARDAGLPLPAGAICLSPWVDLTFSGESVRTNARREFIIPMRMIHQGAAMVLGNADPREPTISPLFADLRGLPPLFIQVGTEEILLDDARRLAERAESAGFQVELEIWQGMVHVWQFFVPYLKEARQAIDRLGAFVQSRVPDAAAPPEHKSAPGVMGRAQGRPKADRIKRE